MPNVVCPTCGTTLAVTEAMLGGEVQCGFCQQVFRTTKAPAPSSAPRRESQPGAERGERERPDDEADSGRRRPRREDDDGDEYADRRRRSRSRSRRDEGDDEDNDRRRRRPRRYAEYEHDDGNGREGAGTGAAVTSMILGIIAITVELPATLMTSLTANVWCGAGICLSWPVHVLGIGLAIPALILGVLNQGKAAGKGMAIAGLATSIAALVLALISIVLIATRPRFPF